jgi:iron(III) transport system substrate-binding protein
MSIQNGRRLLTFVFAMVIVLVLAACAQTPAAQPEAGQPANEQSAAAQPAAITVYTALEDDQLPAYLDGFKKVHPEIEVNIVRDSTGIITARFLAEKDNPVADIVWGTAATSLLVADTQGMLEPYAPAGLEKVNPKFRDPNNPPHWVGMDVYETGFCVNTIEIEKLGIPKPTSWADLLNPAYKGLIVMPNPNSSGTGFLSVSGILQKMGEEEGWSYLDALHENIAQYTHSGSKPCKLAGTGEYPIGISFAYRGMIQKANGEPIETVWPSEGSGWELEANALVKKATINPAAKTFLDWATSEEANALYAKNFPITAVETNVGIPEGYVADPIGQLFNIDLNWSAANRERILEEWLKRYDAKSEPKS